MTNASFDGKIKFLSLSTSLTPSLAVIHMEHCVCSPWWSSIDVFIAGKYTVLEGIKLLNGLTWGVAGRSEEKLKATLKEIGDKAEKDLSATPIIIADVYDEESLKKMAERAKVNMLNCNTPLYRIHLATFRINYYSADYC